MDRKSERGVWLCAAFFAVASVAFTGYRVYFHNQSLQVPLVHLLNDPALYPGDPFAATLPYYASALWRVAAWSTRLIGLEPALLTFFLIERVLLISSAAYLALTLAPGSRLAAVCAMAFFALWPTPILGGGTITMAYFEQTGFAIPFLLLAMAEFRRARPASWAVCMAMAFNCNCLYGVYALTYFAAAIALDPEARSAWRRWTVALAMFAVLASPSIAMAASAYGKGTVDNALWLTAARLRVPHHIFPTTWPAMGFVKFNLVLFLGVILLWRYREQDGRLSRLTITWAAVSLLWLLLAFAAEGIGSSSLLVLQPARATDFWYCFAAVAVIATCAARFDAGAGSRSLLVDILLLVFAFWPVDRFLLRYVVILLVLISPPVWRHVLANGQSRRVTVAVVVAVVMIGSAGLAERVRWRGGIGPAMVRRPSLAERQVARWASERTPKDAVFLVNPNWGEFRALSKRPVFVTWKDGSALLWYRPFVSTWVERLDAIGYGVHRRKRPGATIARQLDVLYASLTDNRARQLRNGYAVRYWVVPLARKSSLPTVFANRRYRVLKNTSARKGNAPIHMEKGHGATSRER